MGPAMPGLGGDEVTAIRIDANGNVYATDTDWTGIATSDGWQTCSRTMAPGTMAAPRLVRTVAGRTYSVTAGTPRDILVNGLSIADDYFRAACISPTDLQISPTGQVSVGLNGGGVLVGPHG